MMKGVCKLLKYFYYFITVTAKTRLVLVIKRINVTALVSSSIVVSLLQQKGKDGDCNIK